MFDLSGQLWYFSQCSLLPLEYCLIQAVLYISCYHLSRKSNFSSWKISPQIFNITGKEWCPSAQDFLEIHTRKKQPEQWLLSSQNNQWYIGMMILRFCWIGQIHQNLTAYAHRVLNPLLFPVLTGKTDCNYGQRRSSAHRNYISPARQNLCNMGTLLLYKTFHVLSTPYRYYFYALSSPIL